MAIQVRRGNYADFDPSKMVAGEFAVCLDNGYVYITLSPNNVVRLGTAETIEEALDMAEAYMEDAEAFAKGTRGGVPVSSTDPAYHNNSKYYSEQAEGAEENGLISEGYAVGNQHGTPVGSSSPYYHNNSKYYCEKAEEYKDEAEAIVGIGIATTTTAGIVKPDGTTITVDSDGTIHGATQATWNDLTGKPFNSVSSEFKVVGNSLREMIPTFYFEGDSVNSSGNLVLTGSSNYIYVTDDYLNKPYRVIVKNTSAGNLTFEGIIGLMRAASQGFFTSYSIKIKNKTTGNTETCTLCSGAAQEFVISPNTSSSPTSQGYAYI